MKLNEALEMVMSELCNYFISGSESGDYTIANGEIPLRNEYLPGQWIAVTKSILNSGVYRIKNAHNGVYLLENGTDGDIPTLDEQARDITVYALAVPPALITLTGEILRFTENEGKPTAYKSESVIGLHSWTAATSKDGTPLSWQDVFRKRLNRWRLMFTDVGL